MLTVRNMVPKEHAKKVRHLEQYNKINALLLTFANQDFELTLLKIIHFELNRCTQNTGYAEMRWIKMKDNRRRLSNGCVAALKDLLLAIGYKEMTERSQQVNGDFRISEPHMIERWHSWYTDLKASQVAIEDRLVLVVQEERARRLGRQSAVQGTNKIHRTDYNGVADMNQILSETKFIENGLEELGYDLRSGTIVADQKYEQHVTDLKVKFQKYQIQNSSSPQSLIQSFQGFQGVGRRLDASDQKVQNEEAEAEAEAEKKKGVGVEKQREEQREEQRKEQLQQRLAEAAKEYEQLQQRRAEQARLDAEKAAQLAFEVENRRVAHAAKLQKEKIARQRAREANLKQMDAVRKLRKIEYKERTAETMNKTRTIGVSAWENLFLRFCGIVIVVLIAIAAARLFFYV